MSSKKLPLSHVKVIEMEGIGPSNMVGMMLADHGAHVILVSSTRPSLEALRPAESDQMQRGKKSIMIDLRNDGHKIVFEKLVKTADVIFDSFRPNTMSKLGFPTERLVDLNPRIIIAKMTAYGSNSKLSTHIGHDINFAALTGILDTVNAIDSDKPVMPSVFIGDVSAVGLCFSSILLALLNKARGFENYQIIDLSYAEASLYYSILPMTLSESGFLGSRSKPASLNGGLVNYNYYQSREGDWYALGALEYRFFLNLLRVFNVDIDRFESLSDGEKKKLVQAEFAKRGNEELSRIILEHTDLCLTRVLDFKSNSFLHDHNRPIMLNTAAGKHVLPATRLGSNKKDVYMSIMSEQKMPMRGQHNTEILKSLNLTHQEIEDFYRAFTNQKM